MESLSTRPKSPPRIEALAKALRPQKEYSPRVLIGNWVEDRIECPKDLNLYHEPEDTTDYTSRKWKPEGRQGDFRQNKCNDLQGSIPLIVSHDERCYKNFLSTNDLVYNHLPKRLCGPEFRYYKKAEHTFYPQPDLMKCLGNLTTWGLSADKAYEWKCTDVSDYISTCFQDSYRAPERCAYVTHRYYRDSRFSKSFASLLSKS